MLVPSVLLFLGHPHICACLPVLFSVVGRGSPGLAFHPHDHRVTGSVAGWGTISYRLIQELCAQISSSPGPAAFATALILCITVDSGACLFSPTCMFSTFTYGSM